MPRRKAHPAGKLERIWNKLIVTSRCGGCGQHIHVDTKFCLKCGRENPQFDPGRFVMENGKTIEELRDNCRRGHEELEDFRLDPQLHKELAELPYCDICGANLAEELRKRQ